ncbi:hypothetical protein OG292_19250 [Streptomyces sp. NBC_01511]|uniref:hypothetical protein n=1 Tax=Streptomyces sp. NBC_01511 TaxID=2903889 RepID=UPI00386476ED
MFSLDHLTEWAARHPWPAAAILVVGALVVVGTLVAIVRTARALSLPPAPVTAAAIGALLCTGYTADTSWRFAEHSLGMRDTTERIIMFAAAEVALLACAVMARANKRATATETEAGTPGTPGVLVWVITGVQVIPAYSESGVVGGTVRAIIGPIMAGLLWHLAMGLEIRVSRPDALSTGLPALLVREVRERLLSYLGLATRDRTAEQITRDRATARAVRLASRPRLRTGWGRHRLAAAAARSGAARDPEQRDLLMRELAARRTAGQLATVDVTSPWQVPAEYETSIDRVPLPEVYPALPAPVPMLVPAGVRLLPIVARPGFAWPSGSFAAASARTRPAVHAEYVPEYPVPEASADEDEEVPEGDRDVPDPDPLLTQVAADFPDGVPGIARLKKTYGIGQARAQRLRDTLGAAA